MRMSKRATDLRGSCCLSWIARFRLRGKVPDPEGLYPTVRDIHQVQLWVPEGRSRVWGRLKKVVGKRVAVTGRLSHAITGHHRTPIQMEVIRFQVRDRRKAESRTR
jgi:hypothetical protein